MTLDENIETMNLNAIFVSLHVWQTMRTLEIIFNIGHAWRFHYLTNSAERTYPAEVEI